MDRAVKRPREEDGVLQLLDAEYKRWGVAETGAFLRREGLTRWEQSFSGKHGLTGPHWLLYKHCLTEITSNTGDKPLSCCLTRRMKINVHFSHLRFFFLNYFLQILIGDIIVNLLFFFHNRSKWPIKKYLMSYFHWMSNIVCKSECADIKPPLPEHVKRGVDHCQTTAFTLWSIMRSLLQKDSIALVCCYLFALVSRTVLIHSTRVLKLVYPRARGQAFA